MERSIKIALVIILATLAAAFTMPAWAQDKNPNVSLVESSNVAIVACIADMTKHASSMSPETRSFMMATIPKTCRESVVVAQVKERPTGGEMAWDVAKFGLGLWAQYKGQALVWGAVTGIVDRMGQSTDTAVQGGFGIASQGIEAAAKPPFIIGAGEGPFQVLGAP